MGPAGRNTHASRLLIRGGSIAACRGVSHGYPQIIRDFCSSRGVEVVCRARYGETSFDGIRTFFEDIDVYRPDILLLHFGVDDAFFPVYRSEFKENLVRMVTLARQRFDPCILMPTSQPFQNHYEMDALQIYYRAIREVCTDLGCELVQVHSFWAGILWEQDRPYTDFLLDDVRYPNEHGHELFAQAILPVLRRVLDGMNRDLNILK